MAESCTLDDQSVFPNIDAATCEPLLDNVSGRNGEFHGEVKDCPENGQLSSVGECKENKRFRAILEQYQRALKILETFTLERDTEKKLHLDTDEGAAKFRESLKTKLESPVFLDESRSINKYNSATLTRGLAERSQESFPGKDTMLSSVNVEDQGSWELITEMDLLNGEVKDARNCLDQESYVVITQEDIVEGVACFMAKYMSSLPETKEMTPKQLQDILRKAFSVSKKGKLRKLWDGGKKLYTAASWGTTVVGLYNNPVLVQAASIAFRTSFHVITKFV